MSLNIKIDRKPAIKMRALLLSSFLFSISMGCEPANSKVDDRRPAQEKSVGSDDAILQSKGTSGVLPPSISSSGSGSSRGAIVAGEGTGHSDLHVKEEVFNQEFDFAGSVFEAQVWVVTSNNQVFRYKIDAAKTYPKKEWLIPSTLRGGNRTYVSEVGLVVGKTAGAVAGGVINGEIWLVNEVFGDQAKLIDTVADAISGSRICVTSFKKDGDPYIGYIYTRSADSKITFVRIPVDLNKDLKIDISRKESFTSTKTGQVAYSCFVDQKNNRFWAAESTLIGVNLNTSEFLDNSALPNNGMQLGIAGSATNYTRKLNYAIAGDAEGNLLNAKIGGLYTYTMAHEHLTNQVFTTTSSTDLIVTDVSCFSKDPSCSNKSFVYALLEAGGPMSSLNDGRVAILSRRGVNSSLMVVGLEDNAHPENGVVVEKIVTIPGDPYMYTDFTGGTMYAPTVEQSFSLVETPGKFQQGKDTDVKITWESSSEVPEDQLWRGIKILVRCYLKSEAKPEYERILPVANAGIDTMISVKKCNEGKFENIDLKLEADEGTSVFTKSKKVVLKVSQ